MKDGVYLLAATPENWRAMLYASLDEMNNETWIIERGAAVIERKVSDGDVPPTPLDELIYCLWVTDYGMRNAGDLDAARDLYKPFQDEATRLSQALGLPITQATFNLRRSELEQQYFQLFDDVCNEIRAVETKEISSG